MGYPSTDLTFNQFQRRNVARLNSGAFGDHNIEWPPEMWALAIAGEAGELCNLLKKVVRGDFTLESQRQNVLHEIADVMTYCDLLVSHLGANTGDVIEAKFEIVSTRIGYLK